jgi:hypothetical protein
MIATVAIAWALVEFVEPILRPIFRRGLELVARNLNFARFAVQRPWTGFGGAARRHFISTSSSAIVG